MARWQSLKHALGAMTTLLVACGGEDRGRPSGDVSVIPPLSDCDVAAQYEFLPIVTFDYDDMRTAHNVGSAACQLPNADCSFYENYDDSLSVPTSNPNADCGSSPAAVASQGSADLVSHSIPETTRCGVPEEALEFKVAGVATCRDTQTGRLGWGASLEIKFVQPGGSAIVPLDATGWDGISFWVKRKSGGSSLVFTAIDDANDSPTGATPNHCSCRGDATNYKCYSDPSKVDPGEPLFPDNLKCDPYGTAVTLRDDWTFVPADFADLHQKGFGFPSGPFEVNQIDRFQFLVTSGDWDFWIDDIALFRRK